MESTWESTTDPATTGQTRVQVRHPALDEQLVDLPRHFMTDGDLVGSHLIAVMSSIFPPGEDFFVRAVRRVHDRVDDPVLQRQVDAFIGQEDEHGAQHRALNERLEQHGYPVETIGRFVDWIARQADKRLSEKANLAITAALEHHTAVVAETLLDIPGARERIGHEGVRNLFLWHALEESEHKAVAFDVYRHIGGTEKMRVRAMNAMNFLFALEIGLWTAWSTMLDPYTWRHPITAVKSLWNLQQSPFVSRRLFKRLADYNRKGFHPDDTDTTEMIARWRTELFGDGGNVTDRLAS